MNKIFKIGILSATIALTSVSCSDNFVETEFQQNVTQGPLTTASEVQSFVRGIYASMRATSYYGADFLAYGEIRSDEMYSTLQGGYYTSVYNYNMLSNDAYAVNTYNQMYTAIAKANVVINTDANAIQGSDADRANSRYAQGQAYGMRALVFFDALRLYGQKYITGGQSLGIVLPLTYDPKAVMPRATIAQTEAQIESDFNTALSMMMANGSATSTTKTELTVYSLKGLMSRYYLYKGDYAKVRSLVNDIVTSGKYTVATKDMLQATFSFTMNGAAPNSIFELAVGMNSSLSTGSYRQRLSPVGYANVVVNSATQALYTTADARRNLGLTNGGIRYLSYYDTATNTAYGKYTNAVGADNIRMLRYEEVLLNGVEAELNGGSSTTALNYYNSILTNRGLAAATTVDMTLLRTERMKELLGEGFRQWDLRRWGIPVPRPANASTNENYNAFPIPRSETDLPNSPIISNPDYDN